jgi:hypothetical protein
VLDEVDERRREEQGRASSERVTRRERVTHASRSQRETERPASKGEIQGDGWRAGKGEGKVDTRGRELPGRAQPGCTRTTTRELRDGAVARRVLEM